MQLDFKYIFAKDGVILVSSWHTDTCSSVCFPNKLCVLDTSASSHAYHVQPVIIGTMSAVIHGKFWFHFSKVEERGRGVDHLFYLNKNTVLLFLFIAIFAFQVIVLNLRMLRYLYCKTRKNTIQIFTDWVPFSIKLKIQFWDNEHESLISTIIFTTISIFDMTLLSQY